MDLKSILFGNNAISQSPTIYDLISKILPNAYIIAGVILFIYMIAGGFMVISSAGNPESAKNGQKIVTNAIIGFVIIFTSYWLIQIISVVTGVPILTPPQSLLQ